MRTLTETNKEISRLDQEREAEQERLRRERQDWQLDTLPNDLGHGQKMMLRINELVMGHTRQMVAEGRLKPHEGQRFAAGLFDQALAEMPTEEYARLTGRVRTPNGVWIESGSGDQLTEAYRTVHRDDVPGDLPANRNQQREIGRRVIRDMGTQLNHAGKLTDAELGALLRENNALPASLIDERTGQPIADDATLGAEVSVEDWDRRETQVGYRAGNSIRDEEARRRAKEEASDPTAKARREMVVSEADAQAWRDKDQQYRSGQTRQGREQLENERQRAKTDQVIEQYTQHLEETTPSDQLGAILSEAHQRATNNQE
jgi:hypothetical protein